MPVALAGGLTAHALAYRIVAPGAHERSHLLASSGHGYMSELRLLAAAGLAFVLVGFLWQAGLAARGLEPSGPSRLVGLVPPLAFVLQEHLERLVHEGAFPVAAFTQPTFLIGLVLQLPFALLAFAAAALLARAARVLGRLLVRPPRLRVPAARTAASFPPPRSALRIAARGRAPPALARP